MDVLPGFDIPKNNENEDENEIPRAKTSKKGGGFQSMGLSFNVLKGVMKRGYNIPTPIQRKTIPLALEGRDVVAMARTGSGKTACFLIPMFEKLKQRVSKSGARALILSPTRELALQTLKFIKELGRFLNLKAAVILGGDSMEDQFSVIHGNPDIIVATPGRFLHVCVEMDLKLSSIEYVVFDEADRLFEMGLGQQLTEIVTRLPDSRQTVLFSATLPKVLVEFAKAGLSHPVLIRLDVESKLPEELDLFYINVRPEMKLAALLVLLKTYIDRNQQTIVFAATKHHVEYLHSICDYADIPNTYIYSNLDPSARKIHAAKFSTGRVKVLIVTDVAARGIDIPQLDNVINFNFPAKAKLFVHRVGRCARAGRTGNAYSLVTNDEYAYLLDLQLFLGRPLKICTSQEKNGNFGRMPQSLIEEQHAALLSLHETYKDLINLRTTSENAYKQYLRSRPPASADSNRRVKDLPLETCSIHPIFKESDRESEEELEDVLDKMKSYRPHGTIFEICGKNKSKEYVTMKEKRTFHKEKIEAFKELKQAKSNEIASTNFISNNSLEKSDQNDINEAFEEVVLPKKRKIGDLYKNKKRPRKDENYIPYVPADRHTEEGLAVNSFLNDANKAELDIIGDSNELLRMGKQQKKWDRKKKKMVGVKDYKQGKIKTESGQWIPATYKSKRYEQWKEKTKVEAELEAQEDDNDEPRRKQDMFSNVKNTHWARHNEKVKSKQRKSEIKSVDQIMKARKLAEKKKLINMKKQKQKKRKIRKNRK